jgi:4-hydroxybenzoate polyprenyltransferase
LLSYIRLMRPQQWVKNGFVFTGLLFTPHAWQDTELVLQVVWVAIAFSLLSSSIYVINDIADREADRQHPTKCKRPIASGEVGIPGAVILSIVLLLGSLIGVQLWVGLPATTVLFIYLVLNLAYSFGLKHVVILDVFIIAAGFMLRILAGTHGVDIEPSSWLLLTGVMVTLFLGFTKRRAELELEEGNQRRVLQYYSGKMLDVMIAATAAGVVLSYSLYTMSSDTILRHGTDNLIFTSPLILYGLFRYLYLLYIHKAGEDPSGLVVRDRHILITVVIWLISTFLILA